jgi:hypothetical protein
MKIKFRNAKLSAANKQRLQQINEIVREYQAQDLVLTLRQLYYQLVSRDIIPNKQNEYSKLSTILKEGRMSGIVDWDAIEDRLRQIDVPSAWSSPRQILETAKDTYRKNRMNGQDNYIEVWVEKDALSGVLSRVTYQYGIPIMVNRGYSSASAMFDSFNRFNRAIQREQNCKLLYLGDFDPSGIDMIRDIRDRIAEFLSRPYFSSYEPEDLQEEEAVHRARGFQEWFETKFEIIPIALTREQIDEYDPPENPAKRTDPRAKDFIAEHGTSSWEVDALRPEVLNTILTEAIEERLDLDKYNEILEEEEEDRTKLTDIIEKNYEDD